MEKKKCPHCNIEVMGRNLPRHIRNRHPNILQQQRDGARKNPARAAKRNKNTSGASSSCNYDDDVDDDGVEEIARKIDNRKPRRTTARGHPVTSCADDERDTCAACGASTLDTPNSVVVCDGQLKNGTTCNKEYHFACLDPSIHKLPEDEFVGPCCARRQWELEREVLDLRRQLVQAQQQQTRQSDKQHNHQSADSASAAPPGPEVPGIVIDGSSQIHMYASCGDGTLHYRRDWCGCESCMRHELRMSPGCKRKQDVGMPLRTTIHPAARQQGLQAQESVLVHSFEAFRSSIRTRMDSVDTNIVVVRSDTAAREYWLARVVVAPYQLPEEMALSNEDEPFPKGEWVLEVVWYELLSTRPNGDEVYCRGIRNQHPLAVRSLIATGGKNAVSFESIKSSVGSGGRGEYLFKHKHVTSIDKYGNWEHGWQH